MNAVISKDPRIKDTIAKLESIKDWPYPKLTFLRTNASKPKYAQMLKSEGIAGNFILRQPVDDILTEHAGPIILAYNNALQIVMDGWILDS